MKNILNRLFCVRKERNKQGTESESATGQSSQAQTIYFFNKYLSIINKSAFILAIYGQISLLNCLIIHIMITRTIDQ